ncbi:kielin/chordin-like protein [Procambarus clarkii]|uniref:kielin/chordin-like protein n=1 Tax=Procambarus clarkii TaxID=6728 RepID=UPI00374484FC
MTASDEDNITIKPQVSGCCVYASHVTSRYLSKCEDAGVTCGRVQCPSVPCTHPAVPSDGCCPVCRDCLFTLRIFPDGDTFVHEHDPCQECQCQAGGVRCESVRCPPLQCAVPRVVQGVCCPFCAPPRQCHFHDAYYDNHQVFPHPHDHCQEWTFSGPLWGPGCSYAGRSLDNHAVFPDPLDPCRSCRCDEGTVSCVPVACPPAYCSRPVTPVGACCPICRECEYDEHVYLEGEVFEASYDACTECRCDYPEVTCYPHVCAPAHCAYPALDARGCCALYCYFEDREIENGLVFAHPRSPCQKCQCLSGSVTCSPIQVSSPATPARTHICKETSET